MYRYEKNPEMIYQQSFAIIRKEAALSGYSEAEAQVAVRLIHSCGMIDLVDDIVISPNAVNSGISAIRKGVPIICDVEMVRHGITKRFLPDASMIECGLNRSKVLAIAEQKSITRSAAGMEILGEKIPGSIVVIGNAPTALFHLLEMIENGLKPPSLIIGCPVGFVGAVESKEALVDFARDYAQFNYISVRGRRGGSAIAAAALNAIAIQAGNKKQND